MVLFLSPVPTWPIAFPTVRGRDKFHPEFNRHCICDNRKHTGDILKLFVVIRRVNIKFNTVFLEIGKLCECIINRKCSENIRK